jgi:hypothetical protein
MKAWQRVVVKSFEGMTASIAGLGPVLTSSIASFRTFSDVLKPIIIRRRRFRMVGRRSYIVVRGRRR